MGNFSYKELQWINVTTKKAIDNDILPDPTILLFPLELDNTKANQYFSTKKAKGKTLTVDYKDRWKYKNYKGSLRIRCTQLQYYNQLSNLIEWYKQRNFNEIMRNIWLNKAGQRLKWLAWQKTDVVDSILSSIKARRSITFCATIEQTEALNIPCVNSKVGTDSLDKFNEGKINSISCVNMLDEGMNLTNCQVGIFMMLNSSERMQVQKCGRVLRHKHPVIIIPYFKNTREEEILKRMLESYNPDFIKTVTSIELLRMFFNKS